MPAFQSNEAPTQSESVDKSSALEKDFQSAGKRGDFPVSELRAIKANSIARRANEAPAKKLEDMMLSELLAQLLRSPIRTWKRLQTAAKSPAGLHAIVTPETKGAIAIDVGLQSQARPLPQRLHLGQLLRQGYARLTIYALAIVLAFAGSLIARGTDSISRVGEVSLQVAAPYLWLGFLLWIAGDIVGQLPQIKAYWRSCARLERWRWTARIIPAIVLLSALHQLAQSMAAPAEIVGSLVLNTLLQFASGLIVWLIIEFAFWCAKLWRERVPASETLSPPSMIEPQWIVERQPKRRPIWVEVSQLRKFIILLAALCSVVLWTNMSGNRIEPPIIVVWLLSVALWGFAFAPVSWNVFDWTTDKLDAWRRSNWRRQRWVIVAFVFIIALGFALRFTNLKSSPPQLISDHVENIKDAYNIRYNNYSPVMFTNYGAREPLHYYLLVALSYLPGLEVDRYAFSLLSAVEGLITLPLLFWLAVEVMRDRQSKFSLVFALLVTALTAFSYWHIHMSRQGFRIALCPLFVTASFIFYARALRHNRRNDYVKSGLFLGLGLISYSTVQMLPVAYVAGIAITLISRRYSLRQRLRYVIHFAVLAWVAFVVFLPLFHFWVEQPAVAMVRHTSRMFGDAALTTDQQRDFLRDNAVNLLGNFRSSALMFHFYGDAVWISGLPDEPVMDPLTAGFLLLGLAAWLMMMLKSRDPVIHLVPLLLFLMLLLPAFALWNPLETPSFMRSNGALPAAFLLAALPLTIFCWEINRTLPQPIGRLVATGIAFGAVLYAMQYNSGIYFGRYTDHYLRLAQPYWQAGDVLQGFAESDGGYGNAFVLPSPHWWDTRAVGIEASKTLWVNDPLANKVPEFLSRALARKDDLRLDPDRDLLFFYSQDNREAPILLSEWFPQGRPLKHDLELESKSFYTYRVPALGWEGLLEFLDANA